MNNTKRNIMEKEELIKGWIETIWETGNGDSHECNTRFDDKRNLDNCISNYSDKILSDLDEVLRGELIKYTQQFYADKETCIHNVEEYLKSQQK